jgi:heme exporter protein CcmD
MMAAPHFGFVAAAYAFAAVVVVGMVAAIVRDYRSLSAALARLESTRADRGTS